MVNAIVLDQCIDRVLMSDEHFQLFTIAYFKDFCFQFVGSDQLVESSFCFFKRTVYLG